MTIVIGSRMGGSYSFGFVLYERPFLLKFVFPFIVFRIKIWDGHGSVTNKVKRQSNRNVSIIGKTDICMQLRIIKNAGHQQ